MNSSVCPVLTQLYLPASFSFLWLFKFSTCYYFILQSHLESCESQNVYCTNLECVEQMLRKDLPSHLKFACLYRQTICIYCLSRFLVKDEEVWHLLCCYCLMLHSKIILSLSLVYALPLFPFVFVKGELKQFWYYVFLILYYFFMFI